MHSVGFKQSPRGHSTHKFREAAESSYLDVEVQILNRKHFAIRIKVQAFDMAIKTAQSNNKAKQHSASIQLKKES